MYFYLKDCESPRRVLEHRRFPVRSLRKPITPKSINKTSKNNQLFQIRTTELDEAVKICVANTNLYLTAEGLPTKNGVSVLVEKENSKVTMADPSFFNKYWVVEQLELRPKSVNQTTNSSASAPSDSNSRPLPSRPSELTYVFRSFKNPEYVFDLTNWRLVLNKFNPSSPGQHFLIQNYNDCGPLSQDPEDNVDSKASRIEYIRNQCHNFTFPAGPSGSPNAALEVLSEIINQMGEEGCTNEVGESTFRALQRELSNSRYGLSGPQGGIEDHYIPGRARGSSMAYRGGGLSSTLFGMGRGRGQTGSSGLTRTQGLRSRGLWRDFDYSDDEDDEDEDDYDDEEEESSSDYIGFR